MTTNMQQPGHVDCAEHEFYEQQLITALKHIRMASMQQDPGECLVCSCISVQLYGLQATVMQVNAASLNGLLHKCLYCCFLAVSALGLF